MLYFDTSAVLPYYRKEAFSERIEALLLAQRGAVTISELTQVEFASALGRWVRMQELTEPQANRVESAFHEDIAAGRFRIQPVNPAMFQRAHHWLLSRRTALRTLDALQLACAEASGGELVTLDEPLSQAAAYLGVSVHHLG